MTEEHSPYSSGLSFIQQESDFIKYTHHLKSNEERHKQMLIRQIVLLGNWAIVTFAAQWFLWPQVLIKDALQEFYVSI